MSPAAVARSVALGGYFGLWLLLPAWYGWLSPPVYIAVGPALMLLLVPLVFPLRGLLRGTLYTYAWTSMLSLLYFAHGVGEAWTLAGDRPYGLTEIALSLMWFTGAILYVRLGKRERLRAQPH